MTIITQESVRELSITWPVLPDDYILPDDPVENTDQPLIAAALSQPLSAFPELTKDALIVSNFALCAAIEGRIICKAPDWMYVRPVNPWKSTKKIRRSYTPHTEGIIPQVVMEFLSETYGEEYSVESTECVGKWFFYEQVIKVPTYVIFRPNTGNLEVYALESDRYQRQKPNESGRFWIPGLELFLGVWEGTHELRTGPWLRWWDAQENMLLWFEEMTQIAQQQLEQERQQREQAEELLQQERQRAQALEERLRSLGIDPEQL